MEDLDDLELKWLTQFFYDCDGRRLSKVSLVFNKRLIELGYMTFEQKFDDNDDVYLQLTDDGKLLRDALNSWRTL